MPTDYSHSNIEPIMLCHPSSLVADGKVFLNLYNSDQSYLYDDDVDQEAAIVPQNLAPEQYRYEFPSKARLKQLAYLDNDDNAYSFFDESSFASTMNASYSIIGNGVSSTDDSDHMYNLSLHEPSALSSSWTDPVNDLAGDDQLDKFIKSITSSYADTRMDTQSGHMPQRGTYWNHKKQPSTFERHDFEDDEYQDEVMQLVDDNGLSPLQLPARANPVVNSNNNNNNRARKASCDSTATIIRLGNRGRTPLNAADPVGPSSFLALQKRHEHVGVTGKSADHSLVHPSVTHAKRKTCHQDSRCNVMHSAQTETLDGEWELPVFYSESEPIGDEVCSFDSDNNSSCESRVVFIKFSRSKYSQSLPSQQQRCATSFTCITSDEGYDEEEAEGELPIESASVFLPLSDKEQELIMECNELRDAAATKIQAAWRGYKLRKERASSGNLDPSRQLLIDLARIYNNSQSRIVQRMEQRISQLEQRLREETAMRTAFEKAMEDMTVLIDQQQKVLYDRIEQEVSLRRTYERRMDQGLALIHPLKSRLQHEIKARTELEKTVSGVVAQLQDMQQAQKTAAKKEEEYKKAMKQKLSDALQEIELLKNKKPVFSTTGGKAAALEAPNRPHAAAAAAALAAISSNTTAKSRTLGKPATKLTPQSPKFTLPRRSSSRLSKTVTPLSSNNLSPRHTIVPSSQATTRPTSRITTTRRTPA